VNDIAYFAVWKPTGELPQTSVKGFDVPDPGPKTTKSPGDQPPQIRQRGDLREAFTANPQGDRVVVGRPLHRLYGELRQLVLLLSVTGGGILTLGLAGGWLLSYRAVKPIQAISATAEIISATSLSRRIDVADTASELGTLAQVLNAMFSRLESSFQQQARFTADASHELRTPVAVIHSHTELALSRDRSPEEYKRTIETCLRASSRMKGLIESLLLLARADGGKLELDRQPFDLGLIAEECVSIGSTTGRR